MATRKTKSTREKKTTRPTKTAKTSRASKINKPVAAKALLPFRLPRVSLRLPALRIRRLYLILGLLVIAALALVVYFRSLFVVATINGQPITRLSYIQELEKLSGQQAMNSLVTKTLIQQEAGKKNVTVSEEEVQGEIKKIEENLAQQGQQLNSVLQLQGMTREALIEQIRLQKLIEKMVGGEIKVEDKEVDAYIEQNKDSLPAETEPEELKNQVREQLRQQKLNESVQSWLQNLQQNADINYWVQQ